VAHRFRPPVEPGLLPERVPERQLPHTRRDCRAPGERRGGASGRGAAAGPRGMHTCQGQAVPDVHPDTDQNEEAGGAREIILLPSSGKEQWVFIFRFGF
jgi:hypothetical protein